MRLWVYWNLRKTNVLGLLITH